MGLGDLPLGNYDSRANAVSADGSVLIGAGDSALGVEAFRWTGSGAGVMSGLRFLPGHTDSQATGVSADGAVIVGWSRGTAPATAFRWTISGGVESIPVLLTAAGVVSHNGWTLTSAQAVSDDGLTIVGAGTNPAGDPEAWLAVLP